MACNLLIADEDYRDLSRVAQALGPLGHKICQTDLANIVSAQKRARADLVVLGLESSHAKYSGVFRALKARDGRFTPILVTMPEGLHTQEEWLKEADDIVTKPVDVPLLQSRVRALLTMKSGGDKLRAEVTKLRKSNTQLRAELDRERASLDMALGGLHDVNNPVSVIQFNLLYAQGALDSDPDETKLALREATEAARRIQELTRQSLMLVEGEERGFVTNLERFKLAERVDAVLSGYCEEARVREVSLRTNVALELFVEADRAALTRVLENLLRNALRYAGGNGVVLVDAGIEGAWLRMSVSNTGVGIDKDQREAVFGRFERDKERPMGSGLGLYLCERIVKAHAGQIGIDDSAQWATRVSVRLPRRVHGIVEPN